MTNNNLSAEQLFLEYGAFVASFLYRLGVKSTDIDDVVQEVFMVVHKKGGYEPGPAKPRSWLAAIALRLAKAKKRTEGRRKETPNEELLSSAESFGKTPEAAAEIAESMKRVQNALDALELTHRAAFVLYEIEGESCEQIAESLSIPVGTVYSRLHTARKRFIEAYEQQVDDQLSEAENHLLETGTV